MTDSRTPMRVLLVGIAALYLGFALPLIPIGADDLRMANVFSIDEADIGIEVWNLYQVGWFRPPSFKYGGVFYYMPVGVLHLIGVFAPVTERLTVIVLRLFCTVAGAGCLAMTYVLGRRLFDRQVGALAALLLVATPTFLRWSVETHPDLPQLFLLMVSLYFCCRVARTFAVRYALLAGVFAGLAFGTKYAGIFLLPVLFAALFVDSNIQRVWANLRQGRRWLGALLGGGMFLLVFVLTNPFAAIYLPSFVNSVLAEKEIMGFGHRVQATADPIQWLYALATLVGSAHCALAVGVGIWLLATRQKKAIAPDRMILLGWIVFFVAYLMLEANLKRSRHLLPVLPGVLLFVGAAYGSLGRLLERRYGVIRWAWLAVPLVVSWGNWQASASLFGDRWSRVDGREEIAAGRWLAERFDPETSILFDTYAYVPRQFQNVYRSIGMTYMLVNHFEPDLLVVRDAIMADYADLNEADVSRMGAQEYRDRHYFYKYLEANRLSAYRLLRDFGRVAVYERTAPRVRSEDDARTQWRDLVRKERDNRRYGQVEALWTMGYLSLTDGLADEAERLFARAREMSNFIPRVYKHGVRLLASGDRGAAQHAFAAAMDAAKGESIAYQAGMREDLAFRYFRAGMFDAAAIAAQQALALTDNLPVAAFELAAARLAGGDALGERLFDDAVKRFGAHPKGLRLLELVVQMDSDEGTARDLMQRHYGTEKQQKK